MQSVETEAPVSVTTPVTSKKAEKGGTDIQRLRDAIPKHCFRPSWRLSLIYIFRDLCLAGILSTAAYVFIARVPFVVLRWVLWAAYGFIQGLVFTGLWELGHELGHGAIFQSKAANNFWGFIIHTCLLTPFFAWTSTHSKHHRYAGHMEMDTDHLPKRYTESHDPATRHRGFSIAFSTLDEYIEDTPLYVLGRLMIQQLFGWPMWLAFLIASGPKSYNYRSKSKRIGSMPEWLKKCQLNPFANIFTEKETSLVLLSDIGIISVITVLARSGLHYGISWVLLLYVQPYLWTNNWIVAITFLHHTHAQVPKFEAESWTYIKGATATVDRSFGFIGRFFFHNVIDYHVVHHLFPRIPFYHTAEATEAIRPILGEAYREDRESGFIQGLWREFTQCQWVAPDHFQNPNDQSLWFIDRDDETAFLKDTKHPHGQRPKQKLATWW